MKYLTESSNVLAFLLVTVANISIDIDVYSPVQYIPMPEGTFSFTRWTVNTYARIYEPGMKC
jgi:hypothetical protein